MMFAMSPQSYIVRSSIEKLCKNGMAINVMPTLFETLYPHTSVIMITGLDVIMYLLAMWSASNFPHCIRESATANVSAVSSV